MKIDSDKTIYNINISGEDLNTIEWALNDIIQLKCPIENNEYIIKDEYVRMEQIRKEIDSILYKR